MMHNAKSKYITAIQKMASELLEQSRHPDTLAMVAWAKNSQWNHGDFAGEPECCNYPLERLLCCLENDHLDGQTNGADYATEKRWIDRWNAALEKVVESADGKVAIAAYRAEKEREKIEAEAETALKKTLCDLLPQLPKGYEDNQELRAGDTICENEYGKWYGVETYEGGEDESDNLYCGMSQGCDAHSTFRLRLAPSEKWIDEVKKSFDCPYGFSGQVGHCGMYCVNCTRLQKK